MSQPIENVPTPRDIPLGVALIPIAVLVGLLYIAVRVFDQQAHVPLILASAVAAVIAIAYKHRWSEVESGMLKGIFVALKACLILMAIGLLIGVWIQAGIVPIMIYAGLKLLAPEIFLVAACLICAIVSLSTGSSWSTAGTVGIALIGVAQGLEIPIPMAAGAIISGAYFGDKMSPLSDTTNLAPAVAGSELFEHIRHMAYTTVPGLLIAVILYAILGFSVGGGESNAENVELILSTISDAYALNPLLFLPPLLVIAMVIFRIPALPAIIGGTLLGALLGGTIQGVNVGDIFMAAKSGYTASTGIESVDTLLSRGGLDSMMDTVALILCAMTFGGIMESTGMLGRIAGAILGLAKSTGSLITATIGSCFAMNVMAPDQFLAIVVPGRMYREAYIRKGLAMKNLSRSLEDGGTLTSPLIAYNTCGAFMCTTLVVGTLDWLPIVPAYAPFAFLNLTVPFIGILYGFTGWFIAKENPAPDHGNETAPNTSDPA